VTPWCKLHQLVEPFYPKVVSAGRAPIGCRRALMEDLVVDKRIGFFVNHDLAGYDVPVYANILHHEVVFLDETDPMTSPMKAKGVGELGICGAGAAVANAIYNATGCACATTRSRSTNC
jgi:xanthine dehydrogenase YagR molybdenum-binding subunit